MQRQRVYGVGEQTRDDQALILAITDTKPTISDLDMRISILSTLQTDDRPIVDSTSVVSIFPNKFASEVRVVDPEQLLNMLIVLGELLRHSGTRRGVKFRADGSETRVNFEVTEATRPIVSVKQGADCGAMTFFKPHGGKRIMRDKEAIQNITKILRFTQGFDIVHENAANVTVTKKASVREHSTCSLR